MKIKIHFRNFVSLFPLFFQNWEPICFEVIKKYTLFFRFFKHFWQQKVLDWLLSHTGGGAPI